MANLPEKIRDASGNVIRQSRNLAGIRRYVSGWHAPIVRTMDVSTVRDGGGQLSMLFTDGSSYQVNFASVLVMASFVRHWRNIHGAPLTVNGKDAGTVSYQNKALAELIG